MASYINLSPSDFEAMNRVYLDERARQDGVLKLAEGALGAQCPDCGKDIIESGELRVAGRGVRCACGAKYGVVVEV